jgi:hypothetical protein
MGRSMSESEHPASFVNSAAQPILMETPPYPLSSRAQPRDLQFHSTQTYLGFVGRYRATSRLRVLCCR